MHVEELDIASLVLDPSNARKHSAKNLEAIKGSLARFGQQKPIVVGKNGVVIAGNGTLEAARSLGWETIRAHKTDLEGTEATAFAIADNRTGELAEWDAMILGDTLKSLQDVGFDLGAIGFDLDDLGAFLPEVVPSEGLTDPDEVPDDVETRCKPGDLWVLGKHRLLCGDSTDVLQVERLMAGEKADMVYTDPPYGMALNPDYDSMYVEGKSKARNHRSYNKVIGDDGPFDPGFILGFFKDTDEIFLWGADYYAERIPERTKGAWFVWDKTGGHDSLENIYGSHFELCWMKQRHKRYVGHVTWKGMCGHNKADDGALKVHPTQKPVALHEWIFSRWGKPADLVADLFLGSGSTLIACEKTGRRCFGMEIDAKYCDVVLSRWERFTGQQASLSSEAKQ